MKRKRSSNVQKFVPDANLPVRKHAAEILKAIAVNDVVVVIAETGSGKTTQIPQLIVEGQSTASVLVTQPRRVAAMSVAGRVAFEQGCLLGEHVGYAVRFDDNSTRSVTQIRYVTDGVMLREALSGGASELRTRYSHIIIDEVHERSVNTDIVLGILKRMLTMFSTNTPQQSLAGLPKLKMATSLPFKVILMSATTDAEKLRNFFADETNLKVGMLNIEGTLNEVRIFNASKPVPDFVDSSVETCTEIIKGEKPGDILAFLPGQEDIMDAISLLRKRLKETCSKEHLQRIHVHPMFSAMNPDEQMRALQPLPPEHEDGGRKIIFATNIAETSVTIPGIRFVIDSGLMKVRETYSDKKFKGDVLSLQAVSKAQAAQRKGRAGRTGPGMLYRLYTDKQYQELKPFPTPEIIRSEATGSLLQIIALVHCFNRNLNASSSAQAPEEDETDDDSFVTFPLLDPIPRKEMEFGLETLNLLGAVDEKMKLTRIGELMSRLPVTPMIARSLLESLRLGCVESMVAVAAVLSVDGPIFVEAKGSRREKILNAQRRFVNSMGDHLTGVHALHTVMEAMIPAKMLEKCKEHYLNYRSIASAISIRNQLLEIMRHGDMVSWGLRTKMSANVQAEIEEEGRDTLVGRCLVAGFFRNVIQKVDERRYMAIGRGVTDIESAPKDSIGDIHPSSVLMRMRRKRPGRFLLFNEWVSTSKPYFKMVTEIERRWLSQHTVYFRGSEQI